MSRGQLTGHFGKVSTYMNTCWIIDVRINAALKDILRGNDMLYKV